MHHHQRTALLVSSCFATLLAAACSDSSSGGSSTPPPPEDSSALTLALTDAPSDDVASFRVELESFRLERSGGGTVAVLTTPAELDLAALRDLRQVVKVRDIPPGLYTSAEATFDFSTAVCVLEGQTTEAELRDPEGNPLDGTLTLPIDLGEGALDAEVDEHVLLELDFDLAQSLVVDAAANTVELEPVVVLRVDPETPKQLVTVGELVNVFPAQGTFRVQAQSLGQASLGTIEFVGLPFTNYHVDGEQTFGPNGLAELQATGPGAWVQVLGAIDTDGARLIATHVAAGLGTDKGGSDLVEGYVISRSGGAGSSPTLVVRGHSADSTQKTFQYNQDFTIETSFAATSVLRWGAQGELDMDDVNVGQRVRAFGALAGTVLNATQPGDVIRLEPTRIYGFANAEPSGGELLLDLERVGPLPESEFNWGESGATPPDPLALSMDVQGLAGGLEIILCTAIESRGFFTPLPDASADFRASSLINVDTGPALLFVRNHPGVGLELAATAAPDSIQLATSGTLAPGEAALVDKSFLGSLALPASPPPTLVPPDSSTTTYLLTDKVTGGTQLFSEFSAFSDALAQAIAGGAQVSQIAAVGPYDWTTNTITAALASACVE
jgi:hypothetical protein